MKVLDELLLHKGIQDIAVEWMATYQFNWTNICWKIITAKMTLFSQYACAGLKYPQWDEWLQSNWTNLICKQKDILIQFETKSITNGPKHIEIGPKYAEEWWRENTYTNFGMQFNSNLINPHYKTHIKQVHKTHSHRNRDKEHHQQTKTHWDVAKPW